MKLWTSSRKLKGGLRRYTWWRGRTKILVVHVLDGHFYIHEGMPIRDSSGVDWPYLIAFNGKASYSLYPQIMWEEA